MKRILMMLTVLAFAAPVAAQPAPPSNSPVSIGAPHECLGFYPPAAKEAHLEGATTLAMKIKPDGSTAEVSVVRSSGQQILDDAATSCVLTWHYAPAVHDGKPVEVPWRAQIVWKLPPDVTQIPVRTGQGSACNRYPWHALSNHLEGTAEVAFKLASDGSVSDASITSSSGEESLDNASTDCVKSWTFRDPQGGTISTDTTYETMATWSVSGTAPARGTIVWKMKGIAVAPQVGMNAMSADARACIRKTPGISDMVMKATGPTVIAVSYFHGEVKHVAVRSSSGSDALDKVATGCFSAAPDSSEREEDMKHITESVFPVRWRLIVPPKRASASPE